MIRAISIRWPWLPAYLACTLLWLLEVAAAAVIWQYGDGSVLGFAALCVAILGGTVTYSFASSIYANRPRRPFYGCIDLGDMQ